MTKYNITEKRLLELLKAEDELMALQGAGVDNWDGYGEYDLNQDLDDGVPQYVLGSDIHESTS